MSITFYYSPQSNATRIHWSLEELGVPYETVKIDLRAGDQKKPEFLALNPNGKVPTLVIDGTPMFESVAIQIALGERYGVAKGLWPAASSPEHLQALSWLAWGQVTLANAMFDYMRNTAEWFPKELQHEKQAERAMKDAHHCLGILEAHLSKRPYVTGEQLTLADIDLGSVLGWSLHAAKVDSAPYPKVAAWLGGLTKRPAAQKTMSAT